MMLWGQAEKVIPNEEDFTEAANLVHRQNVVAQQIRKTGGGCISSLQGDPRLNHTQRLVAGGKIEEAGRNLENLTAYVRVRDLLG